MASNSKTTEVNSHQRLDIQRVQNVLLIWLDSNINNGSEDCQNTITQLRRVVNDVKTYTDGKQCIQFLETIEDRKACMIISGSLGQHIVPRAHNMFQVDSIFIFCGNKHRHEEWAKEWPKIKGVFTEITPICDALKQVAQQCEQNAMSMSFMKSGKKLNQLDSSFMYTQILKEILLTITFDQTHIKNYLDSCRKPLANNERELKYIEKLNNYYHQNTPIWWYTCECFLYSMLNYGLRMMNTDTIILMGFFIKDLDLQIEQLHKEQNVTEIFKVYRGQGLSKEDFEQLKETKGGLMSFNNFLSTSKTREVSLEFALRATKNPDLVGILFVMKIDPGQSTTSFASIDGISAVGSENEVLFSMHSVFRVHDLKLIDKTNKLYEVSLTLTSDNDQELNALTERIREESFPDNEGWERLGLVLIQMGQYDNAKEIYETLLIETTDDSDKAPLYHQLGIIKYNQGDYEEAIIFYKKSLDIEEKNLSSNDIRLASSYNNLGVVYQNMGDYKKALFYYEKDLEISKQSLDENHPDIASSYSNIGVVYQNMGEYKKALSSYEKALAIRQKSLLSNHPDLAASYNNIGAVHRIMSDYKKALSSYEKALAIREHSLPSNHPDLASSYNNIGLVHESLNNYSAACSCFNYAVQIAQQSLSENHPNLQDSKENLERVKNKL